MSDPENKDEPIDRDEHLRQVIDKCRRRLAEGKDFPDSAIIEQFPDLMPELGQALKKLRLIEAAKRAAAPEDESPDGAREAAEEHTENHVPVPPAVDQSHPFPFAEPPGAKPRIRYLGDYELLEELGRGGMGVVYKARQVSLNRTVAVKMIVSGQVASDEEIHRFQTEAEAAAKLEHPNIVPIHEVGEHEGMHFFSMAYVEGQNLAEMIRDQPLPPRQAAEYVKALAEALAYSHSQGVLHRDIKPANVLIDENDQPRITDFGLAKRVDAQTEMTNTGQILGTPQYMPPEQAVGEHDKVGPRSDLYSLGALLYALITGRPPFQADNPGTTIIQVMTQEPVSPRTLNPSIDRDLETICLKCLEKSPDRRYTACTNLASELDRYLAGRFILARPISRPAKAWRWCKRNPVVAALIASVAVVLLVGTIVSTFFAIAAVRHAGIARQQTKEALTQRERAEQQKNRADAKADAEAIARKQAEEELAQSERLLYYLSIDAAHRAWENSDVQQVRSLLKACPNHLRHWEHSYLEATMLRGYSTFSHHTLQDVALSPNGERIAGGSSRSQPGVQPSVWDLHTGRLVTTLDERSDINDWGMCSSFAFSPDGKRVVGGRDIAKIWDASTGRLILTLTEHSRVCYVAYSPNGKHIATGSWGAIKLWNADTGREIRTLGDHMGIVRSVMFSPDRMRIVSGDGDTVKIWDIDTGQNTMTFKGHTDEVTSVAFDPEGKCIVSGARDETVKLWDTGTGQEMMTFRDHVNWIETVTFSPDGKLIASGSLDTTVKLWNARTGQLDLTLKGHICGVNNVAFSPNGQQIVSASGGEVRVWDIPAQQDAMTLSGNGSPVNGMAFSPDGRRIVTASADKTIKLWDVETGQLDNTLNSHRYGVACVAYSRDGTRIASGSDDNSVKVWYAETEELAMTLKGDASNVLSVAFSPDGTCLVAGQNSPEVYVWDTDTEQVVFTLDAQSPNVRYVAFTPDGKQIISVSTATLDIWDARTAKLLMAFKGHGDSTGGVAMSPDGTRIAIAWSDKTVRVSNIQNNELATTLKGHARVVSTIAFSPDGKRIVTGSSDRTVKVWDSKTGQLVMTLKGHLSSINSVVFSPDGKRIASASDDGVVKIWCAGNSHTWQHKLDRVVPIPEPFGQNKSLVNVDSDNDITTEALDVDGRPHVDTVPIKEDVATPEAAVDRGLKWLSARQNGDGGWALHSGGSDAAGTALALLALLQHEQSPQSGNYREVALKGVRWLVDHQAADGELSHGTKRNQEIYAHGIAAMVLCNYYAVAGEEEFGGPAQRAVDFVVAAQHEKGGWRYERGYEGDTSVSGWQIMALSKARAAKLAVPDSTLELASKFLDTVGHEGGAKYGYQPGRAPSEVMTAEGLHSRVCLGWNEIDNTQLGGGVKWLIDNHLPNADDTNLYYWYHGTQLMKHIGGPDWEKWHRHVHAAVIDAQELVGGLRGSWKPRGPWGSRTGRLYTTSLALCILQASPRIVPRLQQPKAID